MEIDSAQIRMTDYIFRKQSKSVFVNEVQFRFILALIGIIASTFFLVATYHLWPKSPDPSSNVLMDSYKWAVAPKPTERFIFLILAIAVPLCAFFASARPLLVSRAELIVLPAIIAVLLFFPLFGSGFAKAILGLYGVDHASIPSFFALIGSLLVSWMWCRWYVISGSKPRISVHVTWLIFAVTVALQLSWRVVSVNSATLEAPWTTHIDAVIYALSQVVSGKTLMVDLPSQYGLFPEIIAPLFRLIGLSVFKLSVTFGVMQTLSLTAIFYVMLKTLKNRTVLIVTTLAIAMVTYQTSLYLAGLDERYFQYWPIRFFWPAISVLAFYLFSIHRSLARSTIVSSVGAIGLLWNIDSGLFITVAYGAYLIGHLFLRKNDEWKVAIYLKAIGLHIIITILIVTGFMFALWLKASQPLNVFWLLKYQSIFYNLGFYSMPLPRNPDAWMSILGVYLIGLLSSMATWRYAEHNQRADMIFYLSMLGLGLFFYYEGRAHVLNLISVCWPAVLIIAILADEMLLAIRVRILPYRQIYLPIVAIAFLLYSGASFLARTPSLLFEAVQQYTIRDEIKSVLIKNELAFIKAHSINGQSCLILSRRQGIYYAESGLSSPVKGPGVAETLLKADEEYQVKLLQEGHLPCIFLGIGTDSNPGYNISLRTVLSAYSITGRNSEGSMLYLTPLH